MSAAVVGAFTWPALSDMPTVPGTMVQIAWYASLILAIASVGVGLHQSVFLMRVGCLAKADMVITELLGSISGNDRYEPRGEQIILWQLAVGLLEFSLYFWLGGFVVFIWNLSNIGRQGQTMADILVC